MNHTSVLHSLWLPFTWKFSSAKDKQEHSVHLWERGSGHCGKVCVSVWWRMYSARESVWLCAAVHVCTHVVCRHVCVTVCESQTYVSVCVCMWVGEVSVKLTRCTAPRTRWGKQLGKDGWMIEVRKKLRKQLKGKCAHDLAYGEEDFERRVVTAGEESYRVVLHQLNHRHVNNILHCFSESFSQPFCVRRPNLLVLKTNQPLLPSFINRPTLL